MPRCHGTPSRPTPTTTTTMCLLYSQIILDKEIGDKNMLLKIDYDFKKTTIAHCSVPMFKRPSKKAGPSH